MNTVYPKESVGRRITFNVPVCGFSDTIADVRKKILEKASKLESLSYIYVLDDKERLKGVFSIKELFVRDDGVKAEEIMDRKVVMINPKDDQEKAAILAIKYNIKAIPVTSNDHRFLGVITSDSILNILHKEHIEDMLLSAGIHREDDSLVKIRSLSIGMLAKIRLPWLIVGLFGGVLAAQIITLFEGTLSSNFILASFIPLVVYISAAVAAQTQMLYVRSLALGKFSSRRYFIKEIGVGVLIGLVISAILFLIVLAISGEMIVALILTVSIFSTIMTAISVGFLISWTLFKMGKDPAIGSGPFGTIVADVSSLVLYFFIVTIFLSMWG